MFKELLKLLTQKLAAPPGPRSGGELRVCVLMCAREQACWYA